MDWTKVITVAAKEQQQREQAYTVWKQQRSEKVSNLSVVVDGLEFQADELSQQRISRTILALSESDSIDWVLKDNSVAKVSTSQLKEVLKQAVLAQANVWGDGRP